MARKVSNTARDAYGELKEGGAAMWNAGADAVADGIESGKSLAANSSGQIAEGIKARPTEALLIAGFIGVVLGIVLAR